MQEQEIEGKQFKDITEKKHTNIKLINNTFEVNVNINFKTSFSSLKSRCHIDF